MSRFTDLFQEPTPETTLPLETTSSVEPVNAQDVVIQKSPVVQPVGHKLSKKKFTMD